jgi:hypothetical protein
VLPQYGLDLSDVDVVGAKVGEQDDHGAGSTGRAKSETHAQPPDRQRPAGAVGG